MFVLFYSTCSPLLYIRLRLILAIVHTLFCAKTACKVATAIAVMLTSTVGVTPQEPCNTVKACDLTQYLHTPNGEKVSV